MPELWQSWLVLIPKGPGWVLSHPLIIFGVLVRAIHGRNLWIVNHFYACCTIWMIWSAFSYSKRYLDYTIVHSLQIFMSISTKGHLAQFIFIIYNCTPVLETTSSGISFGLKTSRTINSAVCSTEGTPLTGMNWAILVKRSIQPR